MSYSGTNGVTNQITVSMGSWTTNTVPLNSQYAGLYGLVQPVTITATATPIGQRFNVPATVSESIQFASIPLFQFAIFYNMNLEIAAAQTLNIVGPVWSNGGLWSGSTTVTFQEYGFRRRHSHQYRQRSFLHWLYWQRQIHLLTGRPADLRQRPINHADWHQQ